MTTWQGVQSLTWVMYEGVTLCEKKTSSVDIRQGPLTVFGGPSWSRLPVGFNVTDLLSLRMFVLPSVLLHLFSP